MQLLDLQPWEGGWEHSASQCGQRVSSIQSHVNKWHVIARVQLGKKKGLLGGAHIPNPRIDFEVVDCN